MSVRNVVDCDLCGATVRVSSPDYASKWYLVQVGAPLGPGADGRRINCQVDMCPECARLKHNTAEQLRIFASKGAEVKG